MDLTLFTALVLTCLLITDIRSAGWGAEGQGSVSPLLLAYLGVVVGLHGGVHGARVPHRQALLGPGLLVPLVTLGAALSPSCPSRPV